MVSTDLSQPEPVALNLPIQNSNSVRLQRPNSPYLFLVAPVVISATGRILSAFAEDHGRMPMDECDDRILRPSSAIADYGQRRQGGCFGGIRRRKEEYHGGKPVEAS